jgi:hypothetical protein
VAVDEHTLCLIPPGISFQDAGAVPVAGLTAWQALEPAMPLQGKRVLVHGGAGGVGGFAIQVGVAAQPGQPGQPGQPAQEQPAWPKPSPLLPWVTGGIALSLNHNF